MAIRVNRVNQGPTPRPNYDSDGQGAMLPCPFPNNGNPAASPSVHDNVCDNPTDYARVLVFPPGGTDPWAAKAPAVTDSVVNMELQVLQGGECDLDDGTNKVVAKVTNNNGIKVRLLNPGNVAPALLGKSKASSLGISRGVPRKLIRILNYSNRYTVTIGSDTTTIRG